MENQQSELNHFLVQVFNEILRIEEDCLRVEEFEDLSVREMHVIEAVILSNDGETHNRSSDIAQALRITAGSLTTSVNLLVKKGYLTRKQDPQDKRIFRLYATEKGSKANAVHQKFHQTMVSQVIDTLGVEETSVLIKGLKSLESFFEKNK